MDKTQEEPDQEIQRINRRKFEQLVRMRQKKLEQTASKPIILTDTNFSLEISEHPIMVVDFWAPWCGPCRMVGPIIEELARDYAGKVYFGKLNVDENPVTSNRFQVKSIPTILIFKNGEPVDGIIGAVPRSHIESKLKSHLSQQE